MSRPFSELVQESLDRRSFVQATMSTACAALLTRTMAQGKEPRGNATVQPTQLFGFENVPASQSDSVVVPKGYIAEVLYRWGDPVDGVQPSFRSDASNSAEDQAMQAGMGHDGMEYFAIPGIDPNERGLVAVNHEYTDQVLLFQDGIQPYPPSRFPLEKVRKSQNAHGVSIIEIARQKDGSWKVVASPRSRRITANTPMLISGPAVARLGNKVAGTVNNCAAGRTPWGTYLTCEENFHGVFGSTRPEFELTEHMKRYRFAKTGYTYLIDNKPIPAFRWHEHDARFDLSHPDNDSDRFGYVVEIDPQDPQSTPIKRTALGRIKHENAAVTLAADGRVVVYMGDDERNEYIYKFVSKGAYRPEMDRKEAGKILDEGTLYVAKFSSGGRGQWLALTPGSNGIPKKSNPSDPNGFDEADIAIRTREAADLAGATPMDRPEWIAIHPETKEVYASLTNNSTRGTEKAVDEANPRPKNLFGHIVRWVENNNDPASENFQWRVFVMAGNPAHPNPTQHGNVAGDAFGCPDGLRFDSSGILWIQTDMSSSYMGNADFAELGNNMMLAADPSTGEVRRFLTGPRGCEITGNAMTPDRKTLFVNIQHPGEPANDTSDATDPNRYSQWPDGPRGGRPRAATIAIRKLDGGVIGS